MACHQAGHLRGMHQVAGLGYKEPALRRACSESRRANLWSNLMGRAMPAHHGEAFPATAFPTTTSVGAVLVAARGVLCALIYVLTRDPISLETCSRTQTGHQLQLALTVQAVLLHAVQHVGLHLGPAILTMPGISGCKQFQLMADWVALLFRSKSRLPGLKPSLHRVS